MCQKTLIIVHETIMSTSHSLRYLGSHLELSGSVSAPPKSGNSKVSWKQRSSGVQLLAVKKWIIVQMTRGMDPHPFHGSYLCVDAHYLLSQLIYMWLAGQSLPAGHFCFWVLYLHLQVSHYLLGPLPTILNRFKPGSLINWSLLAGRLFLTVKRWYLLCFRQVMIFLRGHRSFSSLQSCLQWHMRYWLNELVLAFDAQSTIHCQHYNFWMDTSSNRDCSLLRKLNAESTGVQSISRE